MAEMAGATVVAFIIMFFLSRVTLWLFSSLGDSAARVLLGHAIALAAATIFASFVLADGGLPRLSSTAGTYGLPTIIWAVFDLMRLSRRRSANA